MQSNNPGEILWGMDVKKDSSKAYIVIFFKAKEKATSSTVM